MVVKAMADLFDKDKEGAIRAVVTEVQSIRRLQRELHGEVEHLTGAVGEMRSLKTVIMGVDGSNGIRGAVRDLRSQVKLLQQFVWVATGGCVVVSCVVVPMMLRVLFKH